MTVRKLAWILIPIFLLVMILQRELIQYAWSQGKGQLKIIREAKPVEALLAEKGVSDSLKTQLRLLNDIKQFADSIGLEVSDSYSAIYDQKGQPVLWNVSACQPFAFESIEWSFPFLGSFSYKGFFEKAAADQLVERLAAQGLDVNIRTVGAWSTLGWFNDPLLSNQLYRPVGSMAETIFHELTHATIFFKDSLTYNENLAIFIGEKAALSYLETRFGKSSKELQQYLQNEHDARKYREHMLRAKEHLDSLYNSLEEGMSDEKKTELKSSAIQGILNSLDTVDFFDDGYRTITSRGSVLNNAYLMGFNRYFGQQDELETAYASHHHDLKDFIRVMSDSKN